MNDLLELLKSVNVIELHIATGAMSVVFRHGKPAIAYTIYASEPEMLAERIKEATGL